LTYRILKIKKTSTNISIMQLYKKEKNIKSISMPIKKNTIKRFAFELNSREINSYIINEDAYFEKPDLFFKARKIAIFFYDKKLDNLTMLKETIHGKGLDKIEKCEFQNSKIAKFLSEKGWKVLYFSSKQVEEDLSMCVDVVEELLRSKPINAPYRTIDLCAGIGGIRRGFELTGYYKNVLSAEKDKWACKTYRENFGENPENDITSRHFKELVKKTPYEVLLAGFPCQTFSRVGLEEGFENEEKGKIFHHIVEIIDCTRPCAFLLENVDHLVKHNKGQTFKFIIEELELKLKYKVIGVSYNNCGEPIYNCKDFVRNSRKFGVPQNRPRAYIIGFDRERFYPENLAQLPNQLPLERTKEIYSSLNDLLESNVESKYYLSSGYLKTLKLHRARHESKGNGFGYRVVNGENIKIPIANTLLATGGSGKERNLIYDPQKGIAGMEIKGKRTPLNEEGIRIMTPTEWGKLQGFVNYAFMDINNKDKFIFPESIPDSQKYKQFGNSVTIPVIEEMANYISECFRILWKEGSISEGSNG
jgi:DNA (cytosine-5)-methyltransferase 1